MNEVKELVEELRNKKSRDNRNLLDRSADMIERLSKELQCKDTKDCVVEDEAKAIIGDNLPSTLTNEEKVSEKVKQIEEMAKLLRPLTICFNCLSSLNDDGKRDGGCYYKGQDECLHGKFILEYCNALYNAGYRKQSEGEWIDKPTGAYGRMQSWCSACGKHSGIGGIESNRHKPYCPHCGAKMKGGAE